MSVYLRCLAVPVLFFLTAAQIWADVAPPCLLGFFRRGQRDQRFPPPQPPADPEHELVIVRDPEAKVAELRVPRRLLAAEAAPAVSPRHALAGLAIAVGFVAGGLWCLRFRGATIPRKKLVVAGVMTLLLVGGLTVVSVADANMPPPQYLPPTVELGSVEVTVVMVEEGNALQLVLPPEIADKVRGK